MAIGRVRRDQPDNQGNMTVDHLYQWFLGVSITVVSAGVLGGCTLVWNISTVVTQMQLNDQFQDKRLDAVEEEIKYRSRLQVKP